LPGGGVKILLLGGTSEARRLASVLVSQDVDVVTSLAGRVRDPRLPAGEVRVGGFGGADGLAAWLAAERIDAVVDATHPFAAGITANAHAACAGAGVPLLVLRRPGWATVQGDTWHRVSSLPAVAEKLEDFGLRVFLTIGRLGLAHFAGLDRHWFLVRSVDPPDPPLPPRIEVLLDRGPFTVDGELALLRRHRIDVLVSKDSGGEMTAAKLTAARTLRLPVILVDRPPLPPGVQVAGTVAEAVSWIDGITDSWGYKSRSRDRDL
jgi:precorrin-6A/cobalt-precorrin-6A reductase